MYLAPVMIPYRLNPSTHYGTTTTLIWKLKYVGEKQHNYICKNTDFMQERNTPGHGLQPGVRSVTIINKHRDTRKLYS